PSTSAVQTGADRGTARNRQYRRADLDGPSAGSRLAHRDNQYTAPVSLLSGDNRTLVFLVRQPCVLRGRSRNPYRAPRAGYPFRKHSVRWYGKRGRDFLSGPQFPALTTDIYCRIREGHDTSNNHVGPAGGPRP